jgi:hypothetical protein
MWTPLTPFEQRMAALARLFPPPPSHPLHDSITARLRIESERDIATRLWVKEQLERFPSFVLTRSKGGTNFPIANNLRDFFSEYAKRLMDNGPHSLPTSFNVVESFLIFSHKYFVFDLRDERDHLLRLDDYLDWYTSGDFPETPPVLMDILPEGLIHSYTMAAPLIDFHLNTTDASQLALFGVSMIRHSTELSMISVLGESPAYPPDDEIGELEKVRPTMGKENIQPAPDLDVKDRYLEEAPQLSRLIALVRFDLIARRYNVRYLNIDMGRSYEILTDDPIIFSDDISSSERRNQLDRMDRGLNRYASVFSALASLMFLPVFFIAEHQRVTTSKFGTELLAQKASPDVKKAIKLLGRSEVPFTRDVHCLYIESSGGGTTALDVTPPELDFETAGFWRTLPPGEIGRDALGQPIVGKTWVERTDSWASQRLELFTVKKRAHAQQGPHKGSVYVMRSGSHALDLYKIGRTSLAPEERAASLTATTGVPTQFEVLAHWEVRDAEYVEREAHHRLRAYKVNKRREFFRAPLSLIVATIGKIVEDSA